MPRFQKRCSHNEENPERQQKSSLGSSMRASESEIAQKPDTHWEIADSSSRD